MSVVNVVCVSSLYATQNNYWCTLWIIQLSWIREKITIWFDVVDLYVPVVYITRLCPLEIWAPYQAANLGTNFLCSFNFNPSSSIFMKNSLSIGTSFYTTCVRIRPFGQSHLVIQVKENGWNVSEWYKSQTSTNLHHLMVCTLRVSEKKKVGRNSVHTYQ